MRIFLLLLFVSCSQIQFVQNGPQEFKIYTHHKSEKEIQSEGVVDFYFWGLVPSKVTVDFEKVFADKGVHGPSMVQVERTHSFYTAFMNILTLGFYAPTAYSVKLYSASEFVR